VELGFDYPLNFADAQYPIQQGTGLVGTFINISIGVTYNLFGAPYGR
jgi:hypothetical protein